MIRLQKFLSMAGVCSRRAAERLILQGRVSVRGKVVKELGFKVDPREGEVCVDGVPVKVQDRSVYIVLNKPRGVISTAKDPRGRKTVLDLIEGVSQRLYPVGRLDQDSEGLILLTNDGELTYRLLHPRYKVPKVYVVTVEGRPSQKALQDLRSGVEIEGTRLQPCEIRTLRKNRDSTVFEVVLKEGRKRQIRHMFKWAGHGVKRLVRVRMGPLRLTGLKPGQWRHLTPSETRLLKKAAGLGTERRIKARAN